MKLSIIIINYNTFQMTCNCLRDIYSSKWNFEYEVILIDNASIERNPEDFKHEFPLLTLIKSTDNCGFARGNNLGIAVATGEYLLILNSDTLNLEAGVAACVSYMEARRHDSNLGGVGCKLLSLDGSQQSSAFDYRVGLKWVFLTNSVVSFIAAKLGKGRYRDENYVAQMHTREHAVQAMLGAFMMLRSEAVKKAKPFDPDFFMYYEELEWCYRLNDTGFRLMYIPDASIIHIGQGTSSSLVKADATAKQHFLSIMLLILKQNGYFGILIYNLLFILNFFTNSFIILFRSKTVRRSHKQFLTNIYYSLTKQGFLLRYFKPSFASSSFPFRLATMEEMLNK